LLGIVIFLVGAYVVGLTVRSRFRRHVQAFTDHTLRRIPLIGPVFDLSSRFVGLLGKRDQAAALQSMSPVWCMFGGDHGVAVLALMPNSEPIVIGEKPYLAVLVPTAPVPFGGGLLYVPSDWVRPAGFGMEKLVSVYVSMGVAPPTQSGETPLKSSQP
jgi:uncharacterized membrane protein